MATADRNKNIKPLEIKAARSDGQDYAYADPDEKTNSRPCSDDSADQKWRVNLANYLKAQLQPGDGDDKDYIIVLPAGFELRLINASGVLGGKKGDHAIFGHPHSRTARYRTTGEFIPHLQWLVSDSIDWNDCSCEFCPKLVESLRQRGLSTVAFPTLQTAVPPAPAEDASSAESIVPPTAPSTSSPCNVFRRGEMIWYKLATGWRLGVILTIHGADGYSGPDEENYELSLAPLGHTLLQQESLTKPAAETRPFLTFSVPDSQVPDLKGKAFEDIDWPVFVASFSQDSNPAKSTQKKQIAGLEASKIAAKTINNAFSTFNKVSETPTPTGVVTKYGGVFLGAEMIRVGDPIRITPSTSVADDDTIGSNGTDNAAAAHGTTAMRVAEIVVTVPSDGTLTVLQFCGNVYVARRMPLSQLASATAPLTELGPALAEDLALINQAEKGTTGAEAAADPLRSGWVRTETDAVRAEHDVQGRFYVTHKLMGILDPDRLRQAMEHGEPLDQQMSLNNRGHDNGMRYIGRRPDRQTTVGDAVSAHIALPQDTVEN